MIFRYMNTHWSYHSFCHDFGYVTHYLIIVIIFTTQDLLRNKNTSGEYISEVLSHVVSHHHHQQHHVSTKVFLVINAFWSSSITFFVAQSSLAFYKSKKWLPHSNLWYIWNVNCFRSSCKREQISSLANNSVSQQLKDCK